MDLSKYDNSDYSPGAGVVKRTIWYWINALIFNSWLFPISGVKLKILKMFGARVGVGVVIKPRVNIKYPWNIEVGDHVWIGEDAWIDSLDKVVIGSNVCISQGAYLLTGNHNYKSTTFDLMTGKIHIDDGAWVGAKAVICPDAHVCENAIITVGSVLTGKADKHGIYQGNPAQYIRNRKVAS